MTLFEILLASFLYFVPTHTEIIVENCPRDNQITSDLDGVSKVFETEIMQIYLIKTNEVYLV